MTGDASATRVARASGRRVWLVVGVVCGVSLVGALASVYWADGANGAPTAAAHKSVPVRVEEAARQDLGLAASYRGELDADVAELAAQATGYLISLKVGIGDVVKEGDTLGQVEPSRAEHDIAEAQAEVMSAVAAKRRNAAQVSAAEKELERGQQALDKQLISQKDAAALQYQVDVLRAESDATQAQLLQAQARVSTLRERLRDTRLVAPFDGAVAERYVDPGTVVQPGKPILRLVRSGPLRIRFRVPERDLQRVSVGLRFGLVTQATGDERFVGEVVRIGAEVSRSDRTVAVEGVLPEVQAKLRPGMHAEVRLELGTLEGAVVVPSGSIVERAGDGGTMQSGVYVVADGKARWVKVNVLGSAGDRSAVDAVEAGAAVVTLGQNNLRDGATVRVSERAP